MNIPINQELIDQLRESKGFQPVSLEELKQIYDLLTDKRAKIVVIDNDSYVVFAELIKVEFYIRGTKNKDSFGFIEDRDSKFVDATSSKTGYAKFLLQEFFQGDKWSQRIKRFLQTCLPLVVLNILAFNYAGTTGIKDVVSGILAAVSIFVAIFSLFTTSHDYLLRKRLGLFESGRLGYFFSIDNHITKTGIYTILVSVFSLILCSGFNPDVNARVFVPYSRNILVVVGLNLSFLGVFLTLRAIIEFYVKRPAKFILGDLKRESFEAYRKYIGSAQE